jgi:hypothetical protein
LTSVSKAIGRLRAALSAATIAVSAQPGFGVVVIRPQVGDARWMSIGPKDPTPTAASAPLLLKKSAARAIVSSGWVVGNATVCWTSSALRVKSRLRAGSAQRPPPD